MKGIFMFLIFIGIVCFFLWLLLKLVNKAEKDYNEGRKKK